MGSIFVSKNTNASIQHKPTTTDKEYSTKKLRQTNNAKKSLSGVQSSSIKEKDAKFQNKMDLQLYLHFQRMLKRQDYIKIQDLYYLFCLKNVTFNSKLSKEQIVNETIKYLHLFEENIKPLPPQYYQQLLLLIDYFNSNNEPITKRYQINTYLKDSNYPAKFILSFHRIEKRIDLKQFISFNNWNHLLNLSFLCCGSFGDDDWRNLVEHADHFNNLEYLSLSGNRISEIKEGDIENLKSLTTISLRKLLIKTIYLNPLSKESKEVLETLKKKNKEMNIYFDGLK